MISGIGSGGGYAQMAFSGMRGGASPPDMAKVQEKAFAKMDANSDGGVDKSELSAFLQNTSATNSTSTNDSSDIDDLFSEMDADGDGSITQQETSDAVNNMLKQLQNQMMNSRTGGAGGPPPPPMGPPPDAAQSDEEMFSSIDSNSDGNIDQTELSGMLDQTSKNQGANQGINIDEIFSQDDTDGDGQISKSEFSAAMSQRRSEMESRQMSDASNPQNTTTASNADTTADAFVASLLRQYQAMAQSSANQSFASQLSVAA